MTDFKGNDPALRPRPSEDAPRDDKQLRDLNQALLISSVRQHELTEQAQKAEAAAVRASERELADFFDNASIGLHWIGPDGIIQRVNQAELDMLGYTRDEYVGRHITEFHVDRPVIEDILTRLFGGETLRDQSARLRCKDGSIRNVLINSSALFENGEFIRTRCFTQDVTARLRAETALREQERRFRMVADNIHQFAWTADAEGWIYWYNQRWYDYTGTTLEEMQGWGWKQVHHPDHVDRVVARIQHSWNTGEPWEDTFPLRGKDGQYRWFLSRALPIRDSDGKVLRWFGTNTDITEHRELEQRIQVQAAQLATESRRKDEFLAMLGHELRNPLAPIRSAVHLLKLRERPGNEDAIQRQAREIIERQVSNLTKMVNDLLEVGRVASGNLRLDLQSADLDRLLGDAIETVNPLMQRRRHSLTVHPCAETVWVQADPTRIQQVLVNLLDNAAKYTAENGEIEVWCEHGRDEAGENIAQVRIRDNGGGISRELLPRIFDLFTQGERTLDRAEGGLGVGLALVHRLLELHGGSVVAASPPEGAPRGSEFIVRLPVVVPPMHHELHLTNAPESVKPEGIRVLVVDDNVDHATMLATSLRLIGYSVQSAHTGLDGLKIGQAWRPDIALLDIGLPGLDGYEIARRLRAEPATAGIRLIAVTGYGREDDIARAHEAGFDGHMSKPVDLDDLQRMMIAPGRPSFTTGSSLTH